MEIDINGFKVGDGHPVFFIAEAGVNHNGDVELAKKMVDAAVGVGADAVKFQSYKTESIITESAPKAKYHIKANGGKETWFELLKRLELTEEVQRELFDYCNKRRIIFFSTPYDELSANFLASIDNPIFKIASTDSNNIPLLKTIARYNKPILLSTGMCTLEEVRESVEAIKEENNDQIVLLQCTANYPPAIEDANLNVMDTFKKEFSVLVGYSDHLACSQAAIAAAAKGACVYEAHFTLDRSFPGPDQKSSLEPQELKRIIDDVRFTEKLLGSCDKEVTVSEEETQKKLRKSVVAISNIKCGDKISKDNIGIKRPGTGLPPKYFSAFLGKTAKRNIAKDELIHFQDVVEKE